ncbi:MAG: DEAD/DEAH box helicase [Bacteroidales bacterium]
MLFKEMGLSPEILMGTDALGFMDATPIQEQVIPVLLKEKRDIIGLAQTGTGKTAAFGLPVLDNIDIDANYPQLLVLSPTRELCMQITRDIESYSKFMNGLRTVAVYGGASMDQQIRALKRGVHVVVATPGRIHDLVRRNRIDLSLVSTLVLDEADEMLKMGFRDDLDAILARTPVNKNTLLFSATMASGIVAIAKKYMHDPLEITMGRKNAGAENVSHIFHMVHARDRYNALKRVVDYHPDIYGIVFCRTRKETRDVAGWLMRDGYNAEALHGDLTQAQRDYVMQKFRERNLNVLVATDVAARGLDVNDLTHIINYNLPDDNEVYTHRSGRTGRAGKEGLTVSIINMNERSRISQIENVIRKKIDQKPIPAGTDICERQLFKMVERMQNSEVAHNQIDPYMDKVYDMLGDLPKEEIIKRFVSLEFNRFLEYYRNAPDLNVEINKGRMNGDHVRSRKGEESRSGRKIRNGRSMSRVLFNIGKGKKITKREIIDMLVSAPGAGNAEIGQIDIFKRTSSVEVESKMTGAVIGELNRTIYKGVRIEAEENYEFAGNDFRDRNKGPRGRKRIRMN